LNGSLAAYFVPFAETTSVKLTSNLHPDFNQLSSAERNILERFDATWANLLPGRNYAQSWISGVEFRKRSNRIDSINLSKPIDRYRMAERSVKYAGLFILPYIRVLWWVIEVMAEDASSSHSVL